MPEKAIFCCWKKAYTQADTCTQHTKLSRWIRISQNFTIFASPLYADFKTFEQFQGVFRRPVGMSDASQWLLKNEIPFGRAVFRKSKALPLPLNNRVFFFRKSQRRIKGKAKGPRQQDRIASIKRLSQSKPQTQSTVERSRCLHSQLWEAKSSQGRKEGSLPPTCLMRAHRHTHTGREKRQSWRTQNTRRHVPWRRQTGMISPN